MNKLKYILFFFSVFLTTVLNAQRIFKSEKFHFEVETDLDTTEVLTLSHFIDSELHSIHFVSLHPHCDTRDFFGTGKEIERCDFRTIIDRKSNKLQTNYIKTVVKINEEDFETLFSTLYRPKEYVSRGACYMPRHGILFYNQSGETIGFLEICFQCGNIYSLNLKQPLVNNESMSDLEKLFQKYMTDYFENNGKPKK